jgi:hypothetical protein
VTGRAPARPLRPVHLLLGALLAAGTARAEDELPRLRTRAEVEALDPSTRRANLDVTPGRIPLLVERCPHLVEVHLRTNTTIPAEELRALTRLGGLRRLRIYGEDGSPSEEGFAVIGSLVGLRGLDLTYG